MKENFSRWYEKNKYVKAFMNLMSGLKIDEQCEIAIDIIIKVSSLVERDYTKIIQEVSKFDPKDFKRWYDKNPNIHIAIETLRDLNEKQREEVIKEFTDRIISKHPVKEINL